MTPVPDFPKIYRDLEDTERALSAFWAADEPLRIGEEKLYAALEGLLRALSTLVHGLDREASAPVTKKDVRLGPNTTVGMRVRYVPSDSDDDRAAWGNNKLPAELIDPKLTYVVTGTEVHSWHTKLWLQDVGGPFNSAHFVPAEEPVDPTYEAAVADLNPTFGGGQLS